MTKEEFLIDALRKGIVFFDDRRVLAHWQETLSALLAKEIIEEEFIDMPEQQYSKLIIRPGKNFPKSL